MKVSYSIILTAYLPGDEVHTPTESFESPVVMRRIERTVDVHVARDMTNLAADLARKARQEFPWTDGEGFYFDRVIVKYGIGGITAR